MLFLRRFVTLCAAGFVGALMMLGFAAPASGHAVLVASNPEAGLEVEALPDRVSAQFNEPLQESFAAITLTDAEGNQWSDDDIEVSGDTVSVGVAGAGAAGTYTIAYRVISADSHPVSGTVEFTLTTDGSGEPVTPATETAGEGSAPAPADPDATAEETTSLPAWPFVLGAVIVLGGGIALILKSSSKRA
ncbi:copper resistance CopC family protein [Hoyosella altamirensis]|uniref:CopC domain-containing protein n=1 Tax=Hoyosella altamirensis TaxID=616997 RepID=A0A839RPK2_9ACTN|nr:copper resistance CopC family protein [Hoyosella altamirensis]MBB3038034.1 hypothetical protein [Hoyosella altamirensis]